MSTITTYTCDGSGCPNQTTTIDKGWTTNVLGSGNHKHFCPEHRWDRPAVILVSRAQEIIDDVEKRGWLEPGRAALVRSALIMDSSKP